jgi:hypothetical protein
VAEPRQRLLPNAERKGDVLLTWNCRHIANVMAMPRIRATIQAAGSDPPTITTPTDLLESLGELL